MTTNEETRLIRPKRAEDGSLGMATDNKIVAHPAIDMQAAVDEYEAASPTEWNSEESQHLDKQQLEIDATQPSVIDDSEDGIALLFAENHPEFRWVQQWHKWLAWDGMVWRRDEKLQVYSSVRNLIRSIASTDPKTAKALKKSSTVSAVERMARSDHRLIATADLWDSDLFHLNTDSGIVSLIDGERSEHDPLRYMTKKTACGLGGDCSLWMSFLNDVTNGDQELIAYLQRMVGHAITGSVREHALFFFYGTGRNGKGVFLNTLHDILGDYAEVCPIESLIESKGDKHPTDLAGLMGKRFVIAQEPDHGVRWAEAKIKSMTGGDPITARFMRQDFFTFQPQFKLLIAGNHKPSFKSLDVALRSRLHLIPFTVTIPIEKRDPELPEKLRVEWPEILQWCIDGAVEYQRQGLNPPAAVMDATDEYFQDEDTIQQWVADCCDVDEKHWEPPALLFKSWREYAKAGNFDVGTQTEFKQRLEAAGYPSRKTGKKGRFHEGIRVKLAVNSAPDESF